MRDMSEHSGTLADLNAFARADDAGGHVLNLLVDGIHCASCGILIETTLNKEPDVQARVNLTTRRLSLAWKGDAARGTALANKVAALGYGVKPFDPDRRESDDRQEEKALLRCMAVAGFATGNIMLLSVALWSTTMASMGIATRDIMHWVEALIALPTVLYAGRPFFRSALAALRHGRTNMDVPIAVALVLTSMMSLFETLRHSDHTYFDSVVMLVFLLLVGRWLDKRTRGRARAAAEDLLAMMSGSAIVLDEKDQPKQVPIQSITSGVRLQVAPGERIAADGIVETGISDCDPSFLTGETILQPVAPGTAVFGGMVNVTAPLVVRVQSSPDQGLLGEVVRLMDKAEQGHARYVRLADHVARAYTPVVHALALIAFLGWWGMAGMAWQPALMIAMTVLIITCPCAMGLAVPAVQVLAGTRLFRQGMLLKSADALERLARVDTVVFDKTGTLTLGKPSLINRADIDDESLRLAASMAAQSRHPLARAVAAAWDGPVLTLDVTEHPGQGLETKMNGQIVRLGRRDWCGDKAAQTDENPDIWLSHPPARPLRFVCADTLRADASDVVKRLKQQGLDVHLFSGDREPVVQAVASALGIQDARAGLTPIDKSTAIEALRAKGHRVLMVGDGLNDAAALAMADVSLSPSSALDIAQNAADIVFQGDRLAPVLAALDIAQRAGRLVKENFVLATMYNLIAIPLAMAGYVTPLIASAAMAGSSIAVVLNAQRLGILRLRENPGTVTSGCDKTGVRRTKKAVKNQW